MIIKLLTLATIALVLNFASVSPVRAELAFAALSPNKPTISTKISCAQRFCQSFKIIEEMTPKFMNVANNIKDRIFFRQDLGDRLFNLQEKSGIACLIDAQGSVDGSITCGVIDLY